MKMAVPSLLLSCRISVHNSERDWASFSMEIIIIIIVSHGTLLEFFF
jgi:hypothetical protein